MIKLNFIFISVLIAFFSCSENPFFGGNDYPANRLTITGNVQLQGESDHSGTFVWIEGVKSFCTTDSSGEFILTLQAPERLPGGAGAYTGPFKLYFFMSNYQYDSLSVLLRNGEFEFNQKSVDSNGRLTRDISLRKIFTITTSVSPNVISIKEGLQKIAVSMSLVPVYNGATVQTYLTQYNTLGAFLFARRDTLQLSQPFIVPTSAPVQDLINYEISGTDTILVSLPKGKYEIIPFLRIEQSGIPGDLVTSISEFAYTLTYQYLYVPLKVNSGKLEVIN